MVKLRALFDNADEALFANQFVTVQLLLDTMRDQPVIPVAAVQRGAPGTFVYVVKPDDTVAVQPVKLGPSSGERVAVADGLRPGQVVVIDGADRLRDGAKVRVARAGRQRRRQRRVASPNGRAANAGGAASDPASAASREKRQPLPMPTRDRALFTQARRKSWSGKPYPTSRGAMREPVARLHPAAGRDLAADGGDHAGRRDRLSASAGLGAAGSRLSDDPGARPSIPAPARK